MTALGLAALACLGVLSGLMIGCIGIGGVIVVPALVYIGGVSIHSAIPLAMAGYVLTGVTGTLAFAQKKTIDWNKAYWLCIGAMPAATAGTWAVSRTPSFMLEVSIGLLTAISGLNSLLGNSKDNGAPPRALPNSTLFWAGAFTGLLSALTGTGGPLVLVPILLWLRMPVLTSIGLAQAIQLPIALLATAINLAGETLDLTQGLILGVSLSAGTWLGAKLAHGMNQTLLRRVVSTVLIAIGLIILLKLGFARHHPSAG